MQINISCKTCLYIQLAFNSHHNYKYIIIEIKLLDKCCHTIGFRLRSNVVARILLFLECILPEFKTKIPDNELEKNFIYLFTVII